MFQKSIEAVVEAGVKRLGELSRSVRNNADEADEELKRCRVEIEGLVAIAKEIPDKMFARYANVLVATAEVDEKYGGQYPRIRINSHCESELRGVMGGERIKDGKYRVIVLLEPIQ